MAVEVVTKVSRAASGLCQWCHAMKLYSIVAKEVGPKKAMVAELNATLKVTMDSLAEKQAELKAVVDKVAALEKQAADTVAEKTRLQDMSDQTAGRLVRAGQLTSGLADEGVRWKQTLIDLAALKTDLIGDVFASCACIS